MKLSVELYTLAQRFGDFKAIEIAKEAGFDAIDYSYYYDKNCEEVLGDGYKEYASLLNVLEVNIALRICVKFLEYHEAVTTIGETGKNYLTKING